MAKKPTMKSYRLSASFWDGKRAWPRGAVLKFEEGTAPKGSKPVEEPAPQKLAAPVEEPSSPAVGTAAGGEEAGK